MQPSADKSTEFVVDNSAAVSTITVADAAGASLVAAAVAAVGYQLPLEEEEELDIEEID